MLLNVEKIQLSKKIVTIWLSVTIWDVTFMSENSINIIFFYTITKIFDPQFAKFK